MKGVLIFTFYQALRKPLKIVFASIEGAKSGESRLKSSCIYNLDNFRKPLENRIARMRV
jgi:hypothetical protein